MMWAIRTGDVDWRPGDLTVMSAALVCEHAACKITDLDPIGQPAHLAALVAAGLTGPDMTFESALLGVVQRSLSDVMADHLVILQPVEE